MRPYGDISICNCTATWNHAIIDTMTTKDVALRDIEREERSALTEKLLANARKPLNEIAELTGIPVASLAEKYVTLFEDRGWLTERQEERLLIIELGDFIQDVKLQMANADGRDYAGVAKVVIDGMTLMANRMDSRKKIVEDDINTITQANARMFAHAYDLALQEVGRLLKQWHPTITDEELDMARTQGLVVAKRKLQENTVGV